MSDENRSNPTPEELAARIENRHALTARQRGQLPKVFWAEQDPAERVRNIREVPFAYTPAQARAEAVRCLSCKNEPCVSGCPVGVDVPGFLKLVAEGDFRGAIRLIKETNLLPAICGRVCPQESQCQENCMVAKVHKDLGFAVSVGKIEAFLADWEREEGGVELPAVGAATGRRVAIIGAGPSGLTCAGDLRRFGHEAVVFEAFHKAGGVLVYGIPEFRLPKDIVQAEVDNLSKMGVRFEFDTIVGQTLHDRRPLRRGLRRRLRGHGRGPPLLRQRPRRGPERRLLGQRVPDPGEPDGRVSIPRGGHAGPAAGQRGGPRRRQRRDGRRADGAAPRREARVPRLPPLPRGDARPPRRGAPRRAGGRRVPDALRAGRDSRRRATAGSGR